VTQTQQLKGFLFAIIGGVIVFALSLLLFTQIQSLLLGLIAFLVILWTNEALPLAIVSLLPILLFPTFSILTTKEATANYANPIIFLFLGGFMLAIAFEKTSLHTWIAQKMLSWFPNTPRGMIFSLALTSGLLSSILSNTTTALLLMSIALFITEDKNLKMRFVLAIAYGASVGGIMTPIGTPPNLILLGVMQSHGMEQIAFFQWIWMSAPLAFVMFFVVGSLLSYGLEPQKIVFNQKKLPLDAKQKRILFLTFGLIILLLFNAPIEPYWSGLGLNESLILLGFGLLLFFPFMNILDWMEDKVKIPFRIMFLFGAGFSIAKAFSATGLADAVASYLIIMTDFPPLLLLFCIAVLITFTTEITSNTALISIMLPVIYSISEQSGINTTLFMMVATLCASYAFMLPIATPPNAIAMSSGVVDVRTMMKFGFILNLAGIFFIVMIAEFFWSKIV
jgi:sodium-dependent dicarboxylate transporter 2/3/5